MKKTMDRLADSRTSFCSEADFQHALAWQLHTDHRDWDIRLEYLLGEKLHLDIWAELGDQALALELKYKTLGSGRGGKERKDGAYPVSRYDFVKDVSRLETAAKNGRKEVVGYAIMLTNDPKYWQKPGPKQTIDSSFRIHEGNLLEGTLRWQEGAATGENSGRARAISLRGNYTLDWHDFGDRGTHTSQNDASRYTIVPVTR